MLVHVVDSSSAELTTHARVVADVLDELEMDGEIPLLTVFNKIDQCPEDVLRNLRTISSKDEKLVLVSALTGEGIEDLRSLLFRTIAAQRVRMKLLVAYSLPDADVVMKQVQGIGLVESEAYLEQGIEMVVHLPASAADQFKMLEVD